MQQSELEEERFACSSVRKTELRERIRITNSWLPKNYSTPFIRTPFRNPLLAVFVD
jgi:hypothetical protein